MNKPWYKKWWGIILIILFLWPFFLTYWIWKRNWNIKVRVGLITAFWLFGLIVLAASSSKSGQQSLQEGYKAGKEVGSNVSTPTPTASPDPTINPTSAPSPKPTSSSKPSPTPAPIVSFDETKGNNYIAAQTAEKILNIVSKAAPGYVKSVRIDLVPEEIQGSEEEYKNKLVSVYLTVMVDSYQWSTTNETVRKDLAASFLNAITNTFGGIHHVKINNGVRDVAEAEWPLFGGQPKVKLY